jgi:enterochelin esterase-like enzyme
MSKGKIKKVLAGLSMVGLIAGMAGTVHAEGTGCGKGSCGSGASKEMTEETSTPNPDMKTGESADMPTTMDAKAPDDSSKKQM